MRGQQIIPRYARSEGRLSHPEHLGRRRWGEMVVSFAFTPNADTDLPGAAGRPLARTGWMNSCGEIVGAGHTPNPNLYYFLISFN